MATNDRSFTVYSIFITHTTALCHCKEDLFSHLNMVMNNLPYSIGSIKCMSGVISFNKNNIIQVNAQYGHARAVILIFYQLSWVNV